ncbi:MAG: tetratricopeptide repeat protein [Verrucomicrobiae bacterium]|nr:tetratricopeptide repeat protein [Verrucomicrobiae bacterium]
MRAFHCLKTGLFLLLLGIWIPAALAEDPADQFLKAYFLIQDGDTAKKSDEKDKAIEKYNGALDVLKKIQGSSPEWNPNIINFRIKYCTDNIAALGGTVKASTAAENVAPPAESTTPAKGTGASEAPAPSVASAGGDTESSKKLSDVQNELTETRKQLDQVRKDKEDLEGKLRAAETNLKNLSASKGEGGDKLDERIEELQKENDQLRDQLKTASAKLKDVSAGANQDALAQMKQELSQAKKQLEAAMTENEQLKKQNESLRADLETAHAKLKAQAGTDETIKTMQRENALLRAIVERAYQEDAKRLDQKNQIKTDLQDQAARIQAMEQQLTVLGTPLTPLSQEEKDLLKNPTLVIRETPAAGAAEGGTTAPAGTETAKRPAGESSDMSKAARAAYEKGDFNSASSKYEEILKSDPNNIFALSNLGVIRFRQDRLGEAETLLNKALDIDPTDAFSRSVLGIIYYKQGNYDGAISELTRSIALDSKAPEPHNYLGITYSQKGYQEAAEKELLKAIELNPNYGDAHFNLAVIYATQNPPSISLAKKHYKRALELNVPTDPELEKLFAKKADAK